MMVARTAIAARSLPVIFGVSVANNTAASTGPMVAKKVVKLVSANSSMALPIGAASGAARRTISQRLSAVV